MAASATTRRLACSLSRPPSTSVVDTALLSDLMSAGKRATRSAATELLPGLEGDKRLSSVPGLSPPSRRATRSAHTPEAELHSGLGLLPEVPEHPGGVKRGGGSEGRGSSPPGGSAAPRKRACSEERAPLLDSQAPRPRKPHGQEGGEASLSSVATRTRQRGAGALFELPPGQEIGVGRPRGSHGGRPRQEEVKGAHSGNGQPPQAVAPSVMHGSPPGDVIEVEDDDEEGQEEGSGAQGAGAPAAKSDLPGDVETESSSGGDHQPGSPIMAPLGEQQSRRWEPEPPPPPPPAEPRQAAHAPRPGGSIPSRAEMLKVAQERLAEQGLLAAGREGGARGRAHRATPEVHSWAAEPHPEAAAGKRRGGEPASLRELQDLFTFPGSAAETMEASPSGWHEPRPPRRHPTPGESLRGERYRAAAEQEEQVRDTSSHAFPWGWGAGHD